MLLQASWVFIGMLIDCSLPINLVRKNHSVKTRVFINTKWPFCVQNFQVLCGIALTMGLHRKFSVRCKYRSSFGTLTETLIKALLICLLLIIVKVPWMLDRSLFWPSLKLALHSTLDAVDPRYSPRIFLFPLT